MSVLLNQSQASPDIPLYASAGAGGGGGTDLIVSTITFGGAVTTSLFFPSSVTQGIQCGALSFSGPTNSEIILDPNGIAPNAPMPTGSANIQFDNGSYILEDYSSGQLSLFSGDGNGVSISSIFCSTINGVAPGGGGGVPPNLQISTLAVSSCATIDQGSFRYAPANDGTVQAPTYGFQIESSDGNSLYVRACANTGGLVDDYLGVSTATGTFGLRSLVNSQNAYVGYPSGPGGQDGGQSIYSFSTLTHSAPSTLSLAAPVVLASNLYMSNTTLTLTAPGFSNAGQLYFNSGNSNVYLTNPSTGTLCLGTQSNTTALQVGNNFVSVPEVGASISTLTCSTINGVVPTFTGFTPYNKSYPFTTGSDNAGIWSLNVDSNTGGLPQYLTASATVSSSHTYLVSCDVISGSNGDTTQTSYTKLALALSGSPNDVTLRTFSGLNNFWIYNGQAGSVSALVRGASAIRLYATNTSPNQSTLMVFDTTTGLSISDLGLSS